MKYVWKAHQFWACVALSGMIMAMITGHQMIGGGKKGTEEED